LASDIDLAAFVREHVRSVWALELLLLLKRTPERCWPADELVRELRASKTLVDANLQSFERSGLAVREDTGCYRYAPAAPMLDELASDLQFAYQQRPVATINLISRPSDPLQSLADAFKFKGDRR
jgi:DNA-binding IclR family transcriptional regulator